MFDSSLLLGMEKLRRSQVESLSASRGWEPPCLAAPHCLSRHHSTAKQSRAETGKACGRQESVRAGQSDRQKGGREKSQSPLPRRPCLSALASPDQTRALLQAPDLKTSPDFSTFTFTGNMVWVWSLASWVRGAQKGLASQVKGTGRRRLL